MILTLKINHLHFYSGPNCERGVRTDQGCGDAENGADGEGVRNGFFENGNDGQITRATNIDTNVEREDGFRRFLAGLEKLDGIGSPDPALDAIGPVFESFGMVRAEVEGTSRG